MILHGNARGNSKELAHHLLKDENERVEIFQIRGFVSRNLSCALQESYALSCATKCKQHLYCLSLNPPKRGDPTAKDFEAAINRVEKQLEARQLAEKQERRRLTEQAAHAARLR